MTWISWQTRLNDINRLKMVKNKAFPFVCVCACVFESKEMAITALNSQYNNIEMGISNHLSICLVYKRSHKKLYWCCCCCCFVLLFKSQNTFFLSLFLSIAIKFNAKWIDDGKCKHTHTHMCIAHTLANPIEKSCEYGKKEK